jgi:octaprenyl-diphosphate synthase
MLLICENLGGEENVVPLVPLVELPHQASLIHDDIEDNSPFRRGAEALHVRYGLGSALNTGSFLYFLSLVSLESWEATAEQKYRIFEKWAYTFRNLHLGQSLDIQWHETVESIPDIEEYHTMCRLKTGSLVRLAGELGVLMSKVNDDATVETFGTAAETLGLAFQILDDVQNIRGGTPGKHHGDDIIEGKKSLPILLYLQAHPERADWVNTCFKAARILKQESPTIPELVDVLEQSGAIEEAYLKGIHYIQEVQETFHTFLNEGLTKTLILELIDTIGHNHQGIKKNVRS